MTTYTRRTFQRTKLLAEGERLLAALKAGRSPRDLLLTFYGSRATFYRALRAASGAPLVRTEHGRTRAKGRANSDDDSRPIDPLLE